MSLNYILCVISYLASKISKITSYILDRREATIRSNCLEIPFRFNGSWTKVYVPYSRISTTLKPFSIKGMKGSLIEDVVHHPNVPFLVKPKDIGYDRLLVLSDDIYEFNGDDVPELPSPNIPF